MSEIRVAIIGVGNCASALIQGVHYYSNKENTIGLSHPELGGYKISDIKFVAAFDVDKRKVGKDLSEAIFAEPNDKVKFADVPHLDVEVHMGPVLDGVEGQLKSIVKIADKEPCNVVEVLKKARADIVVNLLPGGAREASQWYAKKSLEAGCAFINATPVEIINDPEIASTYEKAGIPIVGDDLISQVGATFLHRLILNALARRGVKIIETYQLDVGGGLEAMDTVLRAKDLKQSVKTTAVKAALPYEAEVVAGSMDYVDFLGNRRDSYFWIRGVYFGEIPMEIDLRLSTIDGPNAGDTLLDAIRGVKIALDRKIGGPLISVSAYAFKRPPKIVAPDVAEKWFEEFITGVRER